MTFGFFFSAEISSSAVFVSERRWAKSLPELAESASKVCTDEAFTEAAKEAAAEEHACAVRAVLPAALATAELFITTRASPSTYFGAFAAFAEYAKAAEASRNIVNIR